MFGNGSEVQIGTLLLNCASDLTDLVGEDVFLRQRLQLVKSVGVQMVANDLLDFTQLIGIEMLTDYRRQITNRTEIEIPAKHIA
ncbi:hypothetical protein [Bifidobacterium breve]|uniref:hypothetical protein n=1 Tax=Bifidobacterium breve TaxID=1685 RepID=UPI0022B03684|nr:hypothetical protein [Bifidobacterium breve]MCZ4444218.1 hypothetical protein [Bifidobacterium breve]MCZ4445874.1 hypothetical protein [Bifidobacterium breve]MCZ4453393.1 hypothetical protein [Bifidobacterium breve]MDU2059703.1 hypothetical protein [Bifidobacterium breve]MDU2069689.1 hypothetical protein [Bifidobacterium breve]